MTDKQKIETAYTTIHLSSSSSSTYQWAMRKNKRKEKDDEYMPAFLIM
jgi:hypothetical protein